MIEARQAKPKQKGSVKKHKSGIAVTINGKPVTGWRKYAIAIPVLLLVAVFLGVVLPLIFIGVAIVLLGVAIVIMFVGLVALFAWFLGREMS